MKPFVRWSGSKLKYLKYIFPHLPTQFNTYIEPFIGTGAVFLHLKPHKWIINDINKDLINAWANVRSQVNMLVQLFQSFGHEFVTATKDRKVQLCRSLTKKLSTLPYNHVRAAIFILIKYCSYMGHIMRNGKYYFSGLDLNIQNRPSCYFTDKYYSNLKDAHEYLSLSQGRILNKDYKKVLDMASSGDFVFLDPPYFEGYDYQFNYNIDEKIDESFIRELYSQVKKLDGRRVKWLMTQPDTKLVRKTFKEYNITKFPVFRGFTTSKKYELLIKNY